jgi:hypothetical protein
MSNYLFNQKKAKSELKKFFVNEKANLNSFGSAVNQTFEAYTFASTIEWYKKNKWKVKIKNPKENGKEKFKLKFSTRGAPSNYSYALCEKDGSKCQIRHQLRVSTKSYKTNNKKNANICCDITILKDVDLEFYSTSDALPNDDLISFGEVKHMSAFAELLASFIGLVHELQPYRLKRIRLNAYKNGPHLSPYLNVSGLLQPTAQGIKETIEKRKYDIDIFSYSDKMV